LNGRRATPAALTTAALSLALVLALTGCAGPPTASAPAGTAESAWQPVPLPGKRSTEYRWVTLDGQRVLAARAEGSASMMRRTVDRAPASLGAVRFRWRVADLVEAGDVSRVESEDAPARLLLAFDGDTARLPARTRAMFELAHALTGEPPPYATLMYVWDRHAPVGSVIVNPRSDRIRKIVVDSGPQQLLNWREHRRDIAADFRLAFGEEPGRLRAVAVMTDGDNTRSTVRAWYGAVEID
jgi:hypothetical protein